MKVQGVSKLNNNEQEYTVVRPDGTVIFFKLQPADMTDFKEVLEMPEPPTVNPVGKAPFKDYKDAGYLEKLSDYNEKHTQFFIISTLAATPDLEWETIELSDPETWGNFEEELTELGLLPAEIAGLVRQVMRANSLDPKFIQEARDGFLAGKAALQES